MTFRKYALLFTSAVLLYSCNDSKKIEEQKEEVAEEQKKEEAPVYEFGFNLNEYKIVKDTVKSGDTFGKILSTNNIDAATIFKISNQTKEVFNPRKLQVGKMYALLFDKDNPDKPHSFVYEPSMMEYVVINIQDSIFAYNEKRKLTVIEKEGGAYINSSLTESVADAGMSHALGYKLSQVFDYTIDFFHLQKGDNFKAIYEERYVDDSIFAGTGKIKAAYFEHKGTPFYAFNYVTDSVTGKRGFYDEKGNTMKRMFLKAPLDMFRITSRFSLRRFHPVQKRWKGHFGTDYAAPTGTPIRTTASGTVTKAGYSGGNGRYVKIRHNKTYETQYLHMSKILVKKGQYVKQGQVIGLVGSTGLATGPHVCYRFWKNGRQVDPLREVLPPAEPIAKNLKDKYLQDIQKLKDQLDAMKPKDVHKEEETERISQL